MLTINIIFYFREKKDNQMSKNDNKLITSENDTKCLSYVSCESYKKVS